MIKLLFHIIVLISIVIKNSFQSHRELGFMSIELKNNPEKMNTSKLDYNYKTMNSEKYIESIKPFNVFLFKDGPGIQVS